MGEIVRVDRATLSQAGQRATAERAATEVARRSLPSARRFYFRCFLAGYFRDVGLTV